LPAGQDEYRLFWSPSATRHLDRLATTSPSVVGAIVAFCFGRLIADPQRVGHALGRKLAGRYSARVGQYRIIYWIDERDRIVYAERADHRSDVYRPTG
jgi:mRNA interferase RelE/StbE